MLHAELGIKAVDIKIKTRMIGFWLNIVNSKESKLSKLLYKFLLCEYNGSIYQHKWIHCIKEILISVGRVDLLIHKEVIENPKLIKIQISKTLSDLYIQQWHTKVSSSSKGRMYNLFKHDINFENYLTKLTKKHYSALLKFRLSNHRLPVETGRWENTPLDERKCVLCEKNDIGDKFHSFCMQPFQIRKKELFNAIFLQTFQYC